MNFEYPPHVAALKARVEAFMATHVTPNSARFYEEIAAQDTPFRSPPVLVALRARARSEGLWNLFLPHGHGDGGGLRNVEYAPLAEAMGRVVWGAEVFNCNAPDTGNMETLLKYGTPAQQSEWLAPLLEGHMHSAFCMTEPDVASSDATNIATRIERDGDEYVVTGRKWLATGIMRDDCRILIVMGRTPGAAAAHAQHSMILVPRDTPGVTVVRPVSVFNEHDAPGGHGEVVFERARVPASNILLGEGRGFEIAQGRLGPGRIHHCMRLIGVAEAALEAMVDRVQRRVAFGRPLSEFDSIRKAIARSRIEIDQARWLTLATADRIDREGAKAARREIAMIKVAAPEMALRVLDRAMQAHGGLGLTNDVELVRGFVYARTVRMADGPDEVHLDTIGKTELKGRRA